MQTFWAVPFLLMGLMARAQGKGLQNGIWRAVIERSDGRQIVFNFEAKDSAGKKVLYIHNAAERLLADDIVLKGDSVLIMLPFFESQIRVTWVNGNNLKGVWLKRLAEKYQSMPFTAFYNDPRRFAVAEKPPVADVTGRWAVRFPEASKLEKLSVGEFTQHGNQVTGTFLNQTGDYRFLEGVLDGDSLRLSTFDGGHAFLFTAKVTGDSLIGGQYFSGPTFHMGWIAKKDQAAKLPDEMSLTRMRPGKSRFDFAFRDLDGESVSMSDERFRNKVVILQIMGSWCPNCMDETPLLSNLYDTYRGKGLEVIGLAYERSTDFERSQKSLRSFQKRFDVKYPLLVTGVMVSDSLRAQKTLPELAAIEGFPTTIFLNRRGEVEKIHTGFNGPGTGEHFQEQKKEFYEIINELLSK
jgi:thiol-disulfide isomerase/thioredoxin